MSHPPASFSIIVAFFAILGLCGPTVAEHPNAEKLLPEKTLVFVKIKNVEELSQGFMQSGLMKMLQDEKLAPITESLYGSAEEAYAEVEEQLGVTLGELQNLFRGEVCIGLTMEKGEAPDLVVIADYKGNSETANKLLSFGEARAEESGATLDSTDAAGVNIRSVIGGGPTESVHYFQKNDSICLSNNLDLVKLVLVRWQQEIGETPSADLEAEVATLLESRTLNKNRKFLNIVNACDPDEDNPPQAIFFVDVYELIKSSQSGVAGTALVGILRGLGVDGLLGVGGSMTTRHEEYESILHLHVALANPRAGLIKMLALEPGDLEPEPIIPPDVSNYMTMNFNAMTAFNEIEKIYDQFNGEDALAEELNENFTERLGVDLKEDILQSLAGRISLAQWNVESGPLNGQGTMIAIQLKDPDEFEEIFADLRSGIEELRGQSRGDNPREPLFTSEKYRSVEYFVLPGPPSQEEIERMRAERDERLRERGRDVPPRQNRVQFQIRRAAPCVGIVGDYFVFTDSVDFMKLAIKNESNPVDVLADDPDYKQLLREIKNQLDGKKPAMITFSRPIESMRMLYEAVKDPQTQAAIKDRTEDNLFFQALNEAFIENELPPFDELAKYFRPTAGVMTNDETGFHYMTFSPKVELDE